MLKNLLLGLCLIASSLLFSQYEVSTYSGSGVAGHANGSSTTARFNRPVGITSDSKGNLYVCDFNNHCIRKVDTAGSVTTIAGLAGTSGFSNGSGSSARFKNPGGICIDNIGNLYVTDNFNNRIRKIDTTGNVTTVAGNGTQGYIDSNGLNAELYLPRDICIDSANDFLYFVDRNYVIRRIEVNNSKVTTYAGSGTTGYTNGASTIARFNFPASVDIDKKGNLYVADRDNHAIRLIDTTGTVSTICGNGTSGFTNGTGTNARFNKPTNADLDQYGNIYVSDFNNNVIRKIDINNKVTTLAGDGNFGFLNGPASSARFGEVFDIEVVDSNTIFIADGTYDRIRLIKQDTCVTSYDTINVVNCYSYLSPSGNHSWNQSGTYTDTVLTNRGCDSIIAVDLTILQSSSAFMYDTACVSYLSPSGKTFTSGGLFYDTIPNSKGCDSLISIFLQLNQGSSSSISVSACNNYTSPSGSKVWNISGSYKDTVLNYLGCDSIIDISLSIDTINNGITNIGNRLIANQNNVKYQWLDCNNNFSALTNDTNQSFTTFYNGSYAVELRNTCIDTSSCFNLSIVGINENNFKANFRIEPNPSSGRFNLFKDFNITEINVYSISGKLIETIPNPSFSIDLSHLTEGMYLLNIVSQERYLVKKVIIKKD